MTKELPVIITDKNGTVIGINEAAHKVCAAMRIGDNILSSIKEDSIENYKENLYCGSYSFSVPSSVPGCKSFLFDMTKLHSHGICTVYPEGKRELSFEINYDAAAKEFEEVFRAGGFRAKRRFSELYDTLVSRNTVFGANRKKSLFYLRPLLNRFTDKILPSHLYFGGNIYYEESGTVTDKSIIFAEAYSLYMLFSALFSVCGYVSQNGEVRMSISDLTDKTVIRFSAVCKPNASFNSISDFGPRAADLLYAETVARVCGYELLTERSSSDRTLFFTLSIMSHDYYPSYLKTDTGTEFSLDATAALLRYPALTEE